MEKSLGVRVPSPAFPSRPPASAKPKARQAVLEEFGDVFDLSDFNLKSLPTLDARRRDPRVLARIRRPQCVLVLRVPRAFSPRSPSRW